MPRVFRCSRALVVAAVVASTVLVLPTATVTAAPASVARPASAHPAASAGTSLRPVGTSTALKCPASQSVIVINTKARCVALPTRTLAQQTPFALAARTLVTTPALPFATKTKVPAALAAQLSTAQNLFATQLTTITTKGRAKFKLPKFAVRGVITGSASESNSTVKDGVQIDSKVQGSISTDGVGQFGMDVGAQASLSKAGFTVQVNVNMKANDSTHEPCPKLDGTLSDTVRLDAKATLLILKGHSVEYADTKTMMLSFKADGQVLNDARFSYVDITMHVVTAEYANVQHPQSVKTDITDQYRLGRTGSAPTTARYAATVSGFSLAGKYAPAADAKLMSELKDAFTKNRSTMWRDRMLKEEPGWYNFGNKCVKATVAPSTGYAQEGETGTASAKFESLAWGGAVSGRWGRFAANPGTVTPQGTDGSDVTLNWTAGAPNASMHTLEAEYVVTSKAGRDHITMVYSPPLRHVKVDISGSFSLTSGSDTLTGDVKLSGTATERANDRDNLYMDSTWTWAVTNTTYQSGNCVNTVNSASGSEIPTDTALTVNRDALGKATDFSLTLLGLLDYNVTMSDLCGGGTTTVSIPFYGGQGIFANVADKATTPLDTSVLGPGVNATAHLDVTITELPPIVPTMAKPRFTQL